MNSKLLAVTAAVGLVLFALGPGVATVGAQSTDTLDVSVSQAGNAGADVTVTDNGTGVENASVGVEALDNVSYDGVGNYSTDENGTVELPAPEENVTVEVSATVDNVTVSTTADLTAGGNASKESFGSVVSQFVQSLKDNETDNVGQQVAAFVTENNPGNAPDSAGPPENAGPPADDNETAGPPADAGPPENAGPPADDNETTGPPADAGPPAGAGPPADAGPSGDDEVAEEETEDDETDEADDEDETDEADDEDEADEADDEDEADEADDEDEADEADDGSGPPSSSNAGGNGNGNGR